MDTLADLYREVFGRPAAMRYVENPNARPRRPMPRQLRSLEERMRDPNAGVRRQAEREQRQRSIALDDLPRREAYTPPRNQFAEAGDMALEMSGLPAIRRGSGGLTRSVVENTPERAWGALGELGLGAVQVGTLATLPRAGGAAPAPSAANAPRLPVNPVRLPGRASDGSVLPIREPEPFRNSLRGGSEDLFDAASQGSRPAPRPALRANDAGNGGDFDIGPLYRGHDGDPSTGHWRASEGLNGEGVYLTNDEAQANKWALRQAENDPTVHTLRARGPIAEGMTFEEARERGYRGLRYRGEGGYDETVIFDPRDVSPSLSRRAATPSLPSEASQGGSYLDDLRAQGFDVDTPLYHGSPAAIDGPLRPSPDDLREYLFGGVYLTPSAEVAGLFTSGVKGAAPTANGAIYPVYARGPFVSEQQFNRVADKIEARLSPASPRQGETQWTAGLRRREEALRLARDQLRREGFRGVRRSQRGLDPEVAVWDSDDVASRFGPFRSPPEASQGRTGEAARPPDASKSNRSRKPPSGGFFFGWRH